LLPRLKDVDARDKPGHDEISINLRFGEKRDVLASSLWINR
jgi:hypothetical protein